MTETTFSSDDIVIKSPNDRRLYRYIQLPNGLCALLVHDPDIYADGPPKSVATNSDDDEDEDEEDEDDDDMDEDEEDDDDGEKKNAAQTKKVYLITFIFISLLILRVMRSLLEM